MVQYSGGFVVPICGTFMRIQNILRCTRLLCIFGVSVLNFKCYHRLVNNMKRRVVDSVPLREALLYQVKLVLWEKVSQKLICFDIL